MDNAEALGQILDHFWGTEERVGDDWAFDEDGSSMGLDHRSKDGTALWLDINRDGTISIFWKPPGDKGRTFTFAAASPAPPPDAPATPTEER